MESKLWVEEEIMKIKKKRNFRVEREMKGRKRKKIKKNEIKALNRVRKINTMKEK